MMREKTLVVDKNDKILYSKEYGTLALNEIYRVAALWVINKKGEILLAQRSFKKKKNPGKWGPAVAGTVAEGETYESNIIKEAEEELGINIKNLKRGPKERSREKYRHFTQWFILRTERNLNEFKIQEEEVERIKWFGKDEILEELRRNPEQFIDGMNKWVEIFS